MRISDILGFAVFVPATLMLVELVRGNWPWSAAWAVAAVALTVATRYWSVTHPAPMPYRLRWTLRVPRGPHAPRHLVRILQPRSGERLLEVGPGIGTHALPVAASLAPAGTLDVFDVQQEMLDHVMRQADAAGISGITARRGDAGELPYPEGSFDGAYLVGVLGEIPDGRAALRELHRVLKPTGRLVVGEVFFDPDCVFFATLEKRAEEVGFALDERHGGALTWLARFRRRPTDGS